jgi:hypothetical protein
MRRSDAVNTVAADTLNLPMLQGAQKLGLEFQRQLADLIEEQRAPVGDLELASTIFGRTRERPTRGRRARSPRC